MKKAFSYKISLIKKKFRQWIYLSNFLFYDIRFYVNNGEHKLLFGLNKFHAIKVNTDKFLERSELSDSFLASN